MTRKTDTKNLLQRNGTWYLRLQMNGKTITHTLQTSELAEAQRRRDTMLLTLTRAANEKELLESIQIQLQLLDAQALAAKNPLRTGIKLDKAFEKFVKDPERRDCKQQQLDNHRYKWNSWLEWMKEHHPEIEYCREVTRSIIKEWSMWKYSNVKCTNTYNRHLSTIHYVFECLCAYDEDMTNPVDRTHTKPDKDRQSKQPFTEEELRLIFTYPDEEFCRLCAIGLYTTLRLDSARHLDWRQYDGEYLEATHDKTGAPASLRVPSPLKHWLERVPEDERHGLICPRLGTMPHAKVTLYIQSCFQKLGIQTQTAIGGLNGKIRTVCIKGFHSFRHTAITLALSKGATIAQVKRLAGHASERMQDNYTHLGADDAGNAADKLGAFWDEQQ